METEIWPNMVCQTASKGIPVLLANGRLSERSARGYGRLAALTRAVFSQFSQVVAQSADDGARFVALGVASENLTVSGSIKFDLAIPSLLRDQARELRAQWFGTRPVWIAASTHAGEDEILLAAHKALLAKQANALLLLVPRHPERFSKVAELVTAEGFSLQRRSEYRQGSSAIDAQVFWAIPWASYWLLLGCADIAFVGGSLIEHGGYNTLELCSLGIAGSEWPQRF